MRRVGNLHDVPADQAFAAGPVFVEVVVAEEELRLVDALFTVVDADDVEFPGDAAALGLPNRGLERHAIADLPVESFRQIGANDSPLTIIEPRLHLLWWQDVLGIDLHERFRIDDDLREEVGRILIHATEPRVVGRDLDTRHRLQLGLIRDRQRHDQAHLVDEDQPVDARNVHTKGERGADRHQHAKQEERDKQRPDREEGADLLPPEVLPKERQVLHTAAPDDIRTPFSR